MPWHVPTWHVLANSHKSIFKTFEIYQQWPGTGEHCHRLKEIFARDFPINNRPSDIYFILYTINTFPCLIYSFPLLITGCAQKGPSPFVT